MTKSASVEVEKINRDEARPGMFTLPYLVLALKGQQRLVRCAIHLFALEEANSALVWGSRQILRGRSQALNFAGVHDVSRDKMRGYPGFTGINVIQELHRVSAAQF